VAVVGLCAAACATRAARGPESHSDESVQDHIARIERGLLPPVRVKGESYDWTLASRMRRHRVPAISIAVWRDYRLEWARAYGVADAETGGQATAGTLFQAGSISKPVAAMAALKAAERGELDLDGPINAVLRSWKLPENELTRKTPVTLRHLLSHSGGTTVHGFPGYVVGAPVPTIVQILDGLPPANTAAVRVDVAPSTTHRYSGGGTTIVQLALTDRLGRPFPDILAETVLRPIHMDSSTFEQPLPPSRLRYAAAGHDGAGTAIEGKRHVYPEMAAAGLWTTAADLAAFFSEVQLALAGRSACVSRTVANRMLTPVGRAGDDDVGLGTFTYANETTSEFSGRRVREPYFGHSGVDAGFQAVVFASVAHGHGVALMGNSDNAFAVFREVLRAVFAEYHWGDEEPPIEPAQVSKTYMESIVGRYATGLVTSATIKVTGGRLTAIRPYQDPLVLVPTAENTFVGIDDGRRYEISADRKRIMRASKGSPVETWPRLDDDSAMPDVELEAGRFESALGAVRRLMDDHRDHPVRVEQAVNTFGLRLLNQNSAAAVLILHLNVVAFPDSMRAYDSLGVAQLHAGKKAEAIASFRKVLAAMPRDEVTPATIKAELVQNAERQLRALGTH
jgi:CubicO group peptidase (beta-lactamase class C family)